MALAPRNPRHNPVKREHTVTPGLELSRQPANSRTTKTQRVKRELSPTPPPLLPSPSSRTIANQGSKFYKLPQNCAKAVREYKANRKLWADSIKRDFKQRGFRVVKGFIRDDGMAIDWESDTPVWLDTLDKPDPASLAAFLSSTSANTAKDVSSSTEPAKKKRRVDNPFRFQTTSVWPSEVEVIDVDALDTPPPPKLNEPNSKTAFKLAVSSVPSAEMIRRPVSPTPLQTSQPHQPEPPQPPLTPLIVKRSNDYNAPGQSATTESTLKPTSTARMVDEPLHPMEEGALKFLERYVSTFDSDRAALASAYAHDALFSYRIHHTAKSRSGPSTAEAFASLAGSRDLVSGNKGNLHRGRIDVIAALLSLSDHCLCPARITYDILRVDLPSLKQGKNGICNGIFVSCASKLFSDGNGEEMIELDHTFLLRSKDDDAEDSDTYGLWNLIAVSHQLVVRDSRTV